MATEITVNQLLAALLDAQNRCNNLLGAMYNQQRTDTAIREQQQTALSKWKSDNAALSKRIGHNIPTFNKIMELYLEEMLDAVDEIDDLNDFTIREFLDRYGQGLLQMNGVLQTMGQLSS
jgi:hypothetical protein